MIKQAKGLRGRKVVVRVVVDTSRGERKKIDGWKTMGRFCMELAKYSVVALVFADILWQDMPMGKLIKVGAIIAAGFGAIAIVCFVVYNFKNRNKK